MNVAQKTRMNLNYFGGQKSKVKVTIGKMLYNLFNTTEIKPLCVFWSNLTQILPIISACTLLNFKVRGQVHNGQNIELTYCNWQFNPWVNFEQTRHRWCQWRVDELYWRFKRLWVKVSHCQMWGARGILHFALSGIHMYTWSKYLFLIHNMAVFRTAIGSYVIGMVSLKNDCQIFLVVIVAENTGSVNIWILILFPAASSMWPKQNIIPDEPTARYHTALRCPFLLEDCRRKLHYSAATLQGEWLPHCQLWKGISSRSVMVHLSLCKCNTFTTNCICGELFINFLYNNCYMRNSFLCISYFAHYCLLQICL